MARPRLQPWFSTPGQSWPPGSVFFSLRRYRNAVWRACYFSCSILPLVVSHVSHVAVPQVPMYPSSSSVCPLGPPSVLCSLAANISRSVCSPISVETCLVRPPVVPFPDRHHRTSLFLQHSLLLHPQHGKGAEQGRSATPPFSAFRVLTVASLLGSILVRSSSSLPCSLPGLAPTLSPVGFPESGCIHIREAAPPLAASYRNFSPPLWIAVIRPSTCLHFR